ncbi:MAG: tetratricopeptide repeat protein, partial [Candidatus Zixiibacteriota bacterium]
MELGRTRKTAFGRLAGWALILSSALLVAVALSAPKRKSDGLSIPGSEMDNAAQVRERKALEYYMRGLQYKSESNLELALLNFDSALALDPHSYTIRLAKVKASARLGRLEEARRDALLLEPRDPEALRMIVDLYRQTEKADSVVYYLKSLAAADSSDITSRRWLASFYERVGRADSAMLYREQLAELTRDFQSFNELGGAALRAGDPERAEGSFRRSLDYENGPENLSGYAGLVDALGDQGKSAEQREFLGLLLELDSAHVPTLRRFMDYHSRRAEFDSALVFSQLELGQIPEDQNAVRRLGIIAYNADSLDLAEEQFNSLIAIGDVDLINYFFLGRIFLEKGNYRYALLNFRKTVTLADSIADGWLGLAQVYEAMDSTDAIERTYRQAALTIRDPGERVRLFFSLGARRERDGRLSESEDAFMEV